VAVTIMTKTKDYRDHLHTYERSLRRATPRVLVPVDAEPDNSFSREDQDIDMLWELIQRTFDFELETAQPVSALPNPFRR
jgi:hypothetical protein